MECNRKTAVFASFAFGAICAWTALDTPAAESRMAGQSARGLGVIVNGTVDVFGPTGAAVVFMMIGALMAVISALLCPSSRKKKVRY